MVARKSRLPCRIRASASQKRICPACSSASTGSTRLARANSAAPASASPSSNTSSSPMAAGSGSRAKRTAAVASVSVFRSTIRGFPRPDKFKRSLRTCNINEIQIALQSDQDLLMKKILLIEDDADLYSLIQYNLEKEGFTV